MQRVVGVFVFSVARNSRDVRVGPRVNGFKPKSAVECPAQLCEVVARVHLRARVYLCYSATRGQHQEWCVRCQS
eukprot:11180755-Lingulodinium_polyedra.AAC.1